MTDKQPDALALADHLEQFRSFPDDLAAAAELRRLQAESLESDALREKMSDILRHTAIALKGEPGEMTLHSWHDLPEVAMTLRYEVDAIAAIKEERDALRSENAALWADAKRYRWLRDNAGVGQGEHVYEQMAYQFEVLTGVSHVSHIYHYAELPSIDAAIDAARCKTRPTNNPDALALAAAWESHETAEREDYDAAQRKEDAKREEWRAEMRRDVYGEPN